MHENLIFLVGKYVEARHERILGICGNLSYGGHGEWKIQHYETDKVYMIFHESWVKSIDNHVIELEFKNV